MRLMPIKLTKYYFDKISKNRPVILYMHPYEIDIKKYPTYFFDEMNQAGFLKNLKIKSNWIGRNRFRKIISELTTKYKYEKLINVVLNKKYSNFEINTL